MKTKTYLRYISCVLAVLLCVASIMPIAFADSTNHGNSESLLTGSNYSVSYSMNGKDVVEQLTIRDGGITRITRTVHPNDVMDIVVVGASGESTTSTARSDYSLFYEIYQDQQNYKNGQLAQIPALTGSEVTGSQFKHRYVGTSATDTVYASDLRKCKKASDVASILATAWGSTPAAVISSTASFIFDQMLQSMSSDCYKVTISSITYEVLYGDNVFEKHGINRDRTGDREKTRYLCGKRGIFTRDRALIRPGSIRQLETRASTRSASFFHALGGPGRPYNGGGAAGAYRTHNGAKPLKQGHLRAKRGPLGPSRKSQQQTKRTGFAAHGHSIAETAPEGKRASRANGALIRA